MDRFLTLACITEEIVLSAVCVLFVCKDFDLLF